MVKLVFVDQNCPQSKKDLKLNHSLTFWNTILYLEHLYEE